MQFENTQTYVNLARAFAGESQARNRYTIYAQEARKEGQEYLARIFEETADNERVHGEEFLEILQRHCDKSPENIEIQAGYPYVLGSMTENLTSAAHGEWEEFAEVYPAFAKTAQEEGYGDVARLFQQIATIEAVHHSIFKQALDQWKSNTLYQKSEPIAWRCLNCGFTYYGEKPLESCPVCQKGSGWAQGDINTKPPMQRS